MPTLRGWLVAALGASLWVAGKLFGAGPLEQLGFALATLTGIAVIVINAGRHNVALTRSVAPTRARAGTQIGVKLKLVNDGRGPAPLLLLEDRLPAPVAGKARFAIKGIEPQGIREAGYSIKAPRRGRYSVGPVWVTLVDPFGLARRAYTLGATSDLLVYPSVEKLDLPRDVGQQRSLAVSALRQPTGAHGDDFYTLREYVEGDDLKKIHWPSTAKRNRYMIRQEETSWHNRATILLDDRSGAHDGIGDSSSFERAVEATASLADLYHRSGYTYRVTAAHEPGVAGARGQEHLNRTLNLLATIRTIPDDMERDSLLARLAELQAGSAAEGTLVVVAGHLSTDAGVALTRCRRRFRQIIVMVFPPHRFGSLPTRRRWEGEQETVQLSRLVARSGIRVLVLGPGESLATAWTSLSSNRHHKGDAQWDRKPELV